LILFLPCQDGGGNALNYDSSSTVYVNMTTSPGFTRQIRIESIYDPPVNVTSIESSREDGVYGMGEVIDITLVFSDDVILDTSGGGRPYLLLNLTQLPVWVVNNTYNYPPLNVSRVAYGNNGDGRWTKLTFLYTLEEGDYTPLLDYQWSARIFLNGSKLVDLVDRNVSTRLPRPGSPESLSGHRQIVIDTTRPVVLAAAILDGHTSGTYGVGEMFTIRVEFSKRVVVEGGPILPLVVSSNPYAPAGNATYDKGSGDKYLFFNYTVQPGDDAPIMEVQPTWIVLQVSEETYYRNYTYMNHTTNTTLSRLVFNSTLVKWEDKILTAASNPVQRVDLRMDNLIGFISSDLIITLDTTTPTIDITRGITALPRTGSFKAGRQHFIPLIMPPIHNKEELIYPLCC